MDAPRSLPRSNPFSTKFIRPGAIPFQFGPDESAETLVRSLAERQWRGQIIGPHGSGKSTLLATLEGALTAGGVRWWSTSLHDGQRRMPRGWSQLGRARQASLVIVDGYEQLARWQRWLLLAACRRRGWGLLVTAHRDVGLPTLYRTVPSLEMAEQIVGELLAAEAARLPSGQVEALFHAAGGDVRETLFGLYDLWEAEHRRATHQLSSRTASDDCAGCADSSA
jgi:hypothetical protein